MDQDRIGPTDSDWFRKEELPALFAARRARVGPPEAPGTCDGVARYDAGPVISMWSRVSVEDLIRHAPPTSS